MILGGEVTGGEVGARCMGEVTWGRGDIPEWPLIADRAAHVGTISSSDDEKPSNKTHRPTDRFLRSFAALRCSELHPVRAGMVADAEAWPWSSARVHCGVSQNNGVLNLELWHTCWTSLAWRGFPEDGEGSIANLT